MGKTIEITKKLSRTELDIQLGKLLADKKPIDLSKYIGKIDFKVDGLTYQLKARDEWR